MSTELPYLQVLCMALGTCRDWGVSVAFLSVRRKVLQIALVGVTVAVASVF